MPARSRLLGIVSSACLAAVSARTSLAQSTTPKPADDDTIVMQPFQVSSVKSNDYIASDSVTGTRVVSKLRDLPFQVNVVTDSFMKDFAAFDLPDQLGFVSNVSPSDSQGTLTLRGFTTTPFVDGFRRLGTTSIAGVERIEVIKGPAASIYGQVLPGGVVNYITKRPSTTPQQSIDLTAGSHDFRRVAVASTGPLGPSRKLFYRVDYSQQYRQYEQLYSSRRTTYVGGQILWKPDAKTNINLKLDLTNVFNHDPSAVPWVKSSTKGIVTKPDGTNIQYGYVSDPVKGTIKYVNAPYPQVVDRYTNNPADVAAYEAFIANPSASNYTFVTKYGQLNTTNSWDRLGTNLATVRADGPNGYTEYSTDGLTLTADRNVSSLYTVRATFDTFRRPYAKQTNNNNQTYYTDPAYLDGELGAPTPSYTKTPVKGSTFQLDNLFSFKTGKVDHKLLVTFDFSQQSQNNKTIYALSSGSVWKNASGQVYRNADGSVYTGSSSPGTGYTLVSINDKYLITDPISGVQYPATIPLGPRSTGGEIPYPLTPASFFFPMYNQYPDSYTQTRANNHMFNNDAGFFVSERATFFNGRLIALVGGRYDDMNNEAQNYMSSNAEKVKWSNTAFTHQFGLTAYPTRDIILFANQSSTYNPNPQYKQQSDGTFTVFPNEKGKGYEFGTRFVLFNQHLNVGISRFVIDRSNKLDSWTDEFGVTQYIASGSQRSKGWEIDMNWQINDSLQILGGYGYNDAKYTYSSLPYLIGTTTPQSAKDNLGLALRYQIRHGVLKGLAFTADVKALSKSLVNIGSGSVYTTNPFATGNFRKAIYNVPLYSGSLPFPTLPQGLAILSTNATVSKDPTGLSNRNSNKGYTATSIPAGWVLWTPGTTMNANTQYYILDGNGQTSASYQYSANVDDGRMNVFNQPYTIWGFGLIYHYKTSGRYSHAIRFNVKNAFNKFYTYGNGVLGDGRLYLLTYSLSY